MTRWDLVSQALRLDAVRQSQLVAQASILSRRHNQHLRRHQPSHGEQGEARCLGPVAPAPQVSVPGTEWQRGILSLGAAWLTTERVRGVA